MEEKLKLFWDIYDKYIETDNALLRRELSDLLKQVEKHSRKDQLLRPEKAWNEILAWQILRNQTFVFHNHPFTVFAGEIIIWFPHWDRDVFVTRIPRVEFVSGSFLKPGFHLSCNDKGDRSDSEWDDMVFYNGITDERGLYLPLYDSDVILKLCDSYIAKEKQAIWNYLAQEKAWT